MLLKLLPIALIVGMLILLAALYLKARQSSRLLVKYRQRHEEQAVALRELNKLKTQLAALLPRERSPGNDKAMLQEEMLDQIRSLLKFYHKHRKAVSADNAGDQAADGHTADAEWLMLVETTVREHMADSHFNIDHLAKLMRMSRKSLYRKMRACTGLSVNEYIREIRLLVAREKINSGEATNLNNVAAAVGFRTSNYLSRLYRERFGKAPLD